MVECCICDYPEKQLQPSTASTPCVLEKDLLLALLQSAQLNNEQHAGTLFEECFFGTMRFPCRTCQLKINQFNTLFAWKVYMLHFLLHNIRVCLVQIKYVFIYECMYAYMYIYICKHACMYVFMYVYLYIFMIFFSPFHLWLLMWFIYFYAF